MTLNRVIIAALALITPLAARPAVASSEERPNIIIMMADDMGYECLSCNGSLDYDTPHLDGLASQGIRFDNCYSLPICTPTRVKMMTGRYSFRNYERFGLLPSVETTFGTVLQKAGYNTCIVGKWQLGGDWQSPTQFGFDEYCLQNGIEPEDAYDKSTRGRSRYWGYPPMVANGKLYESEETFGPDMLNEFAVNFIKKDREEPFFIYYPMLLTHSPFEPSPLTKGKKGKDGKTSEVQYFDDMVEYTDHLVGNVVKALEESGQLDNTLLIFTGDNGTTYPIKVTASNPDVRRIVAESGRVGELYEAGTPSPTLEKGIASEGPITRTTYGDVPGGKDLMNASGTHVPLVVSWPKHAEDHAVIGNVSDDLIDFSDFFATFAELAGANLPDEEAGDGVSFVNRLTGLGASPRDYVFCHYWHFGRDPQKAREAIHDGEWKLYNDGRFYHVANDLDETQPLDLKQAPEKAITAHKRLTTAYEDLRGLTVPNQAPSKMFDGNLESAAKVITLEMQLKQGQERAKKIGKEYDEASTTRFFNAKDRNGDGVIDASENKLKVAPGWNDVK